MGGTEEIQRIVSEVLRKHSLPQVAFGEDSCAVIEINGLAVTFMHSTDPVEILWIIVDLGVVPADPALYRGLLRYGVITWVTGQMTIALDDDGEHLVGFSSIPVASLTEEVLQETLDRILTGSADVLDRIAHHDFELLDVAADKPPETPAMDWRA